MMYKYEENTQWKTTNKELNYKIFYLSHRQKITVHIELANEDFLGKILITQFIKDGNNDIECYYKLHGDQRRYVLANVHTSQS